MAATKIIPIKNRLDTCINYVKNPDKTTGEKVIYQSAINCTIKNAYRDMMHTKERFGKTDKVQGYHIIQSFKPTETTPDEAHAIGVEFAQSLYGDKYEVVITTHLDKEHLHNHIVLNSVSLVDGKKYRGNFKDYFVDIRGKSDEICKQHGLSVITLSEQSKSLSYAEWLANNSDTTTWYSILKLDIDQCIKTAFNYGNFLMLMEQKGYELKQGKYLAFRHYSKSRYSRTYKLGNSYTIESIKSRIFGNDLTHPLPTYKRFYTGYHHKKQTYSKSTSFERLCLYYMYLLTTTRRNQAPPNVFNIVRDDLIEFDKMIETHSYIKKQEFKTLDDVKSFKDKCYKKLAQINERKNMLLNQKNNSKAYKALLDIKNYKIADDLYKQGYENMVDESKLYQEAVKTLSSLDIDKLETEYSELLNETAKCYSKIQELKEDIRYCKRVEEYQINAQEKVENFEQLQEVNNDKYDYTKEKTKRTYREERSENERSEE